MHDPQRKGRFQPQYTKVGMVKFQVLTLFVVRAVVGYETINGTIGQTSP